MIVRLLALLGGAATPFAFAPYGQGWLIFPLLGCLIGLWRRYPERAFSIGWTWGFGQFLVGAHWVYISAHTYSGAPVYFALFITLLLALYLGSYHGLVGWLWQRYSSQRGAVSAAFLLGLWLAAELLRKWVFSGFPWLSLGYSQIDMPFAGFAPLVGVYGVGGAVLVCALSLEAFVSDRQWKAAVPVALLAAASVLLVGREWNQSVDKKLTVAVVQANIDQAEKWTQPGASKAIAQHLNLTYGAPEADLVVWPEVALPGTYQKYREVYRGVHAWLKSNDAVLVAGSMRHDGGGQFANSIIVVGGEHALESPPYYDKQHLVPFGEFFPVPQFVKTYLQAVKLPYTDLFRGSAGQPQLTVHGVPVSASICFEDGFATEMIGSARHSQMLINVSNDAWFGRSNAAHTHLEVSRMRALEFGRPLVRSTPTGVGAIVDHLGRVVSQTDRFVPQVIIESVALRTGDTPYMRVGDWPIKVIMILCLVLGVRGQRISR